MAVALDDNDVRGDGEVCRPTTPASEEGAERADGKVVKPTGRGVAYGLVMLAGGGSGTEAAINEVGAAETTGTPSAEACKALRNAVVGGSGKRALASRVNGAPANGGTSGADSLPAILLRSFGLSLGWLLPKVAHATLANTAKAPIARSQLGNLGNHNKKTDRLSTRSVRSSPLSISTATRHYGVFWRNRISYALEDKALCLVSCSGNRIKVRNATLSTLECLATTSNQRGSMAQTHFLTHW